MPPVAVHTSMQSVPENNETKRETRSNAHSRMQLRDDLSCGVQNPKTASQDQQSHESKKRIICRTETVALELQAQRSTNHGSLETPAALHQVKLDVRSRLLSESSVVAILVLNDTM